MVGFGGWIAPTVANAPIPMRASPSPVTTMACSSGWASAIPKSIIAAPPIAPQK